MYVLIIFLPTVFYIFERFIPTKNNLLEKTGILFLIIITGLRVGPGADYYTYMDVFKNIQYDSVSDKFEIGFVLVNKIIAYLCHDFNGLLLIIAVFNGIILYLVINNNVEKNYRWLAIFIYLSYFDLYVYSLSALRQSITISICMYISKYIYTNEKLKYFLWTLLAISFHWSAIIFVPFYFLYRYLLNTDLKKLFIVATFSIAAFVVLNNYLYVLQPYLGNKLNYYLFIEQTDLVEKTSITNAFIALMFLIIWILFNSKVSYQEKNKWKYYYDVPTIGIIFFFILKCIQNLSYYSIIPRLQMYFYCFLPIALANTVSKIKGKKRIIIIFFIIIFFLLFFYIKYKNNITFYKDFRLVRLC